jgi:hypothetical protein
LSRGQRYADWIDRNRVAILVAAVVVAGIGGWLSSKLAIRPDFSHLLPPSQQSVRHLRALEKRAQAFGTAFVVAESSDPALRERAARALEAELEDLDPSLISAVVFDDGPARQYFWENRFLFVPLADLTDARDALKSKIREAKLAANPFYISLEDDEPGDGDVDDRVEDLRERLDDAEARANAPDGFVSDDGTMQLLVVRTAFNSADFSKTERLLAAIERAFGEVRAELGDGVELGVTGDLIKSLDEQRAVMRGMRLAAAITILVCAIALLLYYRSGLPVLASLLSLAVGVLATFAFAKLAIGHLNLVTAFLAAIVVGNGINPGLILLSRYFEELRAGHEGNGALGRAIPGALRGTLAASLAAGTAYGSLVITDFRGFRHFGVIGFVGMVLCWIAAFTILPAGLAWLWRMGWIRPHKAPAVGNVLARLLPRDMRIVAYAGVALTLVSAVATWRYVAGDPLQEDWSNLRPDGSGTREALQWSEKIKRGFTTKFQQGLSQRFVIGAPTRGAAPEIVKTLRAVDKGAAKGAELMSTVTSLDDLVPANQPAKLALLAEIRALLDDDAVQAFADDDKQLMERIRPPAEIATLGDADVPEKLAWMFTEKDGTRGRLILAASSLRFKTWNVRDRMEFAKRFRELDLPEGTLVGGQSFLFADMVHAMGVDGPKATIVALLGAIFAVVLVVGVGRYAAVTMACALAGILGMIALVSAVGLEVNVIDFIALPITIGLGVDYAVNIVERDRQDGHRGAHWVVATTGGAVLLCSFTTMVGYGSLLLSDSGGIRSFGLAAILGEIACVISAIALAPALLRLISRRAARGGLDPVSREG